MKVSELIELFAEKLEPFKDKEDIDDYEFKFLAALQSVFNDTDLYIDYWWNLLKDD